MVDYSYDPTYSNPSNGKEMIGSTSGGEIVSVYGYADTFLALSWNEEECAVHGVFVSPEERKDFSHIAEVFLLRQNIDRLAPFRNKEILEQYASPLAWFCISEAARGYEFTGDRYLFLHDCLPDPDTGVPRYLFICTAQWGRGSEVRWVDGAPHIVETVPDGGEKLNPSLYHMREPYYMITDLHYIDLLHGGIYTYIGYKDSYDVDDPLNWKRIEEQVL